MLCPLLLTRFGAGGVITISALLAVLAVGVAAAHRRGAVAAVAVPLGILGLWILPTVDERFPVPNKGIVDLSRGEEDVARREYCAWTTNSRVDLVSFGDWWTPRIYGLGAPKTELPPFPEQMHIFQDADASTIICNFSEHPESLALLEHSLYSTALQLKDRPRVFIIGAGGGNDIWAARLRDARLVKAIELNRPIVDVHRERLPHFSRDLLDDPNVEMVVGEGRSAIMRDPGEYDVIQMTGIDTWTALASGAYVLAENYLYTREAIESFYDHLAEDGILQVVRYAADMEALRLFSNIHAAFEAMSVPDFAESVIAVRTTGPRKLMASLVKRGTFTEEEIAQVERFAETNGMELVYAPGRDVRGFVPAFIRAEDKQEFIDACPRNISPTTDDKPYFFNFTRWSKPLASQEFLEEPTCVSQGNPLFLLVQLGVSAALGVRIAIAVALLAPIGLLLGVPFAYGIRVLDERNPSLIPWAWSINGCLSVMGSILTVVISMNLGFRVVLVAAVLVYVIAFGALRSSVSPRL